MPRKNTRHHHTEEFSMDTRTLHGSLVSDNVRYNNSFVLNGTPKHARAMRVLRENQKKKSS